MDISYFLGQWVAANGDNTTRSMAREALEQLPDGTYALTQNGAVVIGLDNGDRVWTVEAGTAGTGPVLTSIPLDEEHLIITFQVTGYESGRLKARREHLWTFRYRDEIGTSAIWQKIPGVLTMTAGNPSQPDDREKLARAIASRCGWPVDVEERGGLI
jgi:uncharacterized cupin superfamily protein